MSEIKKKNETKLKTRETRMMGVFLSFIKKYGKDKRRKNILRQGRNVFSQLIARHFVFKNCTFCC